MIMSAWKLNYLLLMHVHQHRTDKLNLVELAKEFISLNSGRMNFYDCSCTHLYIVIGIDFLGHLCIVV